MTDLEAKIAKHMELVKRYGDVARKIGGTPSDDEWKTVRDSARELAARLQPPTDEQLNKVTKEQWETRWQRPNYAAHRAYARAVLRLVGIGASHD